LGRAESTIFPESSNYKAQGRLRRRSFRDCKMGDGSNVPCSALLGASTLKRNPSWNDDAALAHILKILTCMLILDTSKTVGSICLFSVSLNQESTSVKCQSVGLPS